MHGNMSKNPTKSIRGGLPDFIYLVEKLAQAHLGPDDLTAVYSLFATISNWGAAILEIDVSDMHLPQRATYSSQDSRHWNLIVGRAGSGRATN